MDKIYIKNDLSAIVRIIYDYLEPVYICILNKKIKNEINTRNNKKHYDSLKVKRENLINKYTQISKLN